jgi:hypothetical protein
MDLRSALRFSPAVCACQKESRVPRYVSGVPRYLPGWLQRPPLSTVTVAVTGDRQGRGGRIDLRVYGLAGNAARIGPRHLYRHAGDLFDVTPGSNTLFSTPASACGDDYLCTAKPGYDAPTGLGTPNGLGAF